MNPISFLTGAIMGGALLAGRMSCAVAAMVAVPGGDLPAPRPLFPADNWWNADVRSWPVDPNSEAFIAFINNGGSRRLHPDLGGKAPSDEQPFASYGIPYVIVSGVTEADLVPVEFRYWQESDGVDHRTGRSYPFYPIPPQAVTEPYWIEGGPPGDVDLRDSQDRHLLLVDADRNWLYELYNVFFDRAQGQWRAGSGAFFDLRTNRRRPETWTSADAAGLAILPGLVRFDEVYDPQGAEIGHAFRVTVRATDGYVYPASHRAGSRAGALPMGARLRLKSPVDVARRTKDQHLQRVFRAMQKHGLIVADNGSDMYITGTYDPRWDNGVVNPAFRAFTASDFEVIQLGYVPPPDPKPAADAGLLRARVVQGVLHLEWEQMGSTLPMWVQVAESLEQPVGWRTVAEKSEASWSEGIDPLAPARFYRVVGR